MGEDGAGSVVKVTTDCMAASERRGTRDVRDVRRSMRLEWDVYRARRTVAVCLEVPVHMQEAHGDTAPSFTSDSGGRRWKRNNREMPVQS